LPRCIKSDCSFFRSILIFRAPGNIFIVRVESYHNKPGVKPSIIMKISEIKMKLILLLLLVSVYTVSRAQDEDKSKRPSPPATATGMVGSATITIDYSSPGVKGREIWGKLVPYDQPWRAGANEATIFKTDKDIMVEGQSLKAGSYSFFTLPGMSEWKIIFNSETGQWGDKEDGSANFDPAKNVLTVSVKPMKSDKMNERLAFVVSKKGFSLNWENLSVPVSVK